jgi:acyl-CoA thioesterase-2
VSGIGASRSTHGGVSVFEGRNQQLEYRRVAGGQRLGQFLRIAALICPEKAVTSQHAVFAEEGRAAEDGMLVASCGQEALVRFSETL